jgi:hypothetical protein
VKLIGVNGEVYENNVTRFTYKPKFLKGDCVNYKAKSRKLKKNFIIEEVVFSNGRFVYLVRNKWVPENLLELQDRIFKFS